MISITFLVQIFRDFVYTVLRHFPYISKPKSKNYLIIGASSGIGRSLVVQLAKKAKEDVGIAIASRKIDELNSLKKEIEANYPKAKVFVRKFDITHFNDSESLMEDCSRALGSIDTLVINAGINDMHKLGDEDYFKKSKSILDTNLTGPISVISAFVKYAKKIHIVNPYIVTVSSIASSRVFFIDVATSLSHGLWNVKERIGFLYPGSPQRVVFRRFLDNKRKTRVNLNCNE
eukprot:NODE_374_length_9848_cov_0.468971.p4 type:complete len:232 gc:universal NODE_374_length_9848_cov_0.468971:4620-5315(+)